MYVESQSNRCRLGGNSALRIAFNGMVDEEMEPHTHTLHGGNLYQQHSIIVCKLHQRHRVLPLSFTPIWLPFQVEPAWPWFEPSYLQLCGMPVANVHEARVRGFRLPRVQIIHSRRGFLLCLRGVFCGCWCWHRAAHNLRVWENSHAGYHFYLK